MSVKLLEDNKGVVELTPCTVDHGELPGGWRTLSVQFLANLADTSLVAVGFIIGFVAEDSSQPFDFSVLLGQLNVFPTRPPNALNYQPYILWANFEPSVSKSPESGVSGILTWDVAVSLAPVTVGVTSPEDPVPVWEIDGSDNWFPSFVYFNVYVQFYSPDGVIEEPESAMWVGTTGLDGRANRFIVPEQPIAAVGLGNVNGVKKARFYVRGVSDHGTVLRWDQSAFVDVDL
jgi:mannosyl-glycoprotein endo-beta-N-acetylglucosaminidase